MSTFRTAIFYLVPDVIRDERFNVGLAMISPEHKFCKARFIGAAELALRWRALEPIADEDINWWGNHILTEHERIAANPMERGREFALRFDHPHIFTALYGRSQPLQSLQWRDATMGLLRESTPEQEFEEQYKRMIERPSKPQVQT